MEQENAAEQCRTGSFPDETSANGFRLSGTSLDISEERSRRLLVLFPEARGEDGSSVNFVRLREVLGDVATTERERYFVSWAGRSEALRATRALTTATLLPDKQRSIDFDDTAHAIIEGDNLQVLKVIQKAYIGKIKLIYIDPPYNTGNDFIYPDDFSESLQTYLAYTGQIDSDGRRFGTNPETDGRFHSRWMSMMYPRIEHAWSLLREDGIIMVSIDDQEMHNLRLILNERFGEENYCGTFVWEKKKKPSFLDAMMASKTEYIMCYAKDRSKAAAFTSGVGEMGKMYPFNNAGNPESVLCFPAGSVEFNLPDGVVNAQDMSEGNIKTRLLDTVEIRNGRNVDEFRLRGEWRYSQAKLNEFVSAGASIVIRRLPFRPNYVNDESRDKKIANLLTIKGTGTATYEDATEELRGLFGRDVMTYPKPAGLLEFLVGAATSKGDIVLDFFAGSGTTAHAILNLNARDGLKRQFILVQLPEPTGDTEYPAITDICEARVRLVAERLNEEYAGRLQLDGEGGDDRGFRVFKLAQSNVKEWDATIPHDAHLLREQLQLSVDHLRPGRSELDVLFEVLLKSGFPLSSKITEDSIAGKKVYSVAEGAFLICLDRRISLELIRELAAKRPERVLVLDEGFAGNDQLKANAVQTFETKKISFRTL